VLLLPLLLVTVVTVLLLLPPREVGSTLWMLGSSGGTKGLVVMSRSTYPANYRQEKTMSYCLDISYQKRVYGEAACRAAELQRLQT
jgi:hypothetical protein